MLNYVLRFFYRHVLVNHLHGCGHSTSITFDYSLVCALEILTGFEAETNESSVTHSSHFGYDVNCSRLSYTAADLNFKLHYLAGTQLEYLVVFALNHLLYCTVIAIKMFELSATMVLPKGFL